MTLSQLRYLIAVVDQGFNITQAAQSLHATQPGLSKQLKQLEQWLGFELFARRGKTLEGLSEPGALVVEQARQMLAAAERVRALRASYAQDQGGELRIATTATQARHVLPAAIAQLRRDWPSLRIQLTPAEDEAALAALEANACDVAIVSAAEPPSGLYALPLYHWERQALMDIDHPLAGVPQLGLSELSAHPLVSYTSALRPGASLEQAFGAAGLPLRVGMSVSDGDLIKTYVRAGIGIGILAPMALRPEDGDLAARSLQSVLPRMTTWFVLRPQQTLTRALTALLDHLAPHLDSWAVRQQLLGDPAAVAFKGKVPEWQPMRGLVHESRD